MDGSEQASFRRLYWLFVPVLAIAAYVMVLRVGFLSDDFLLLHEASASQSYFDFFRSDPSKFFYRPVGQTLTWQLGWDLFGFRPLPYHLIGLLLHAAIATLLGFWFALVTRRPVMGWLAGALFAVFPLNTEAVGWLASQWDLWAAFFTLVSLCLFVLWWRDREARGNRNYFLALSISFFVLALLSKESILAFLPIYGISVWIMTSAPLTGKDWRRLGLALLPYIIVLLLYGVLRLILKGGFATSAQGPEAPVDVSALNFVWDILVNRYAYMLLAPLNNDVLSGVLKQWVAAVLGLGLLAALIVHGREALRYLFVALAWFVFTVAPTFTLALAMNPFDLQQNRFLYLPSAGFCMGVAILIYTAIASLRGKTRLIRPVGAGLVGLLIVGYAVVSWVNLRPWQAATNYTLEINQQIQNLIPYQPRPAGTVWYVQNTPDSYQGVYLFRLGLGNIQRFTRDPSQTAALRAVGLDSDLESVVAGLDLKKDTRDLYAMRFDFDKNNLKYNVSYISGITGDLGIPVEEAEGSTRLMAWDFTQCSEVNLAVWPLEGGAGGCTPGEGLTIETAGDTQTTSPAVDIDLQAAGAWYVRVRASVVYPSRDAGEENNVSTWHWRSADDSWDDQQRRSLPVVQDGKAHVYWTYMTFNELSGSIAQLRFNPIDAGSQVQIRWIAVDLVR